ncbi:XRE family transcriptional regulator [Listeria monocytogenes]|nr:XRE family transcriptional regulator [Listeria monocytogenes]
MLQYVYTYYYLKEILMQKENLTLYIGTQIKKLRKKNKITQKDLAKKLGVAPSTITNYETGFRSANQDILFELAEIFGVNIDYFFPNSENNSETLNLRERELIANYKKLKEADKLKVEGFIMGLYESKNKE